MCSEVPKLGVRPAWRNDARSVLVSLHPLSGITLVPSANMAIFLTLRPLDFSINNSRGLVHMPT